MTELEEKQIIEQWQEFAQKKVYAFRGVSDAAYKFFFADFAKSILKRSIVKCVYRPEINEMIAWSIIENIPNSETKIVHFVFVDWRYRNKGIMKELLQEQNIHKNSKTLFSLLTVFAEQRTMKDYLNEDGSVNEEETKRKRYHWLYSPFNLYK